MKTELKDIKENSSDDINNEIDLISGNKTTFLRALEEQSKLIYDDQIENFIVYNENYKMPISTLNSYANGDYVLDLVKGFGRYERATVSNKEYYTPNSIVYAWVEEFKDVSDLADDQMGKAKERFGEALRPEYDNIVEGLGKG